MEEMLYKQRDGAAARVATHCSGCSLSYRDMTAAGSLEDPIVLDGMGSDIDNTGGLWVGVAYQHDNTGGSRFSKAAHHSI